MDRVPVLSLCLLYNVPQNINWFTTISAHWVDSFLNKNLHRLLNNSLEDMGSFESSRMQQRKCLNYFCLHVVLDMQPSEISSTVMIVPAIYLSLHGHYKPHSFYPQMLTAYGPFFSRSLIKLRCHSQQQPLECSIIVSLQDAVIPNNYVPQYCVLSGNDTFNLPSAIRGTFNLLF